MVESRIRWPTRISTARNETGERSGFPKLRVVSRRSGRGRSEFAALDHCGGLRTVILGVLSFLYSTATENSGFGAHNFIIRSLSSGCLVRSGLGTKCTVRPSGVRLTYRKSSNTGAGMFGYAVCRYSFADFNAAAMLSLPPASIS
jgi:hypothetical protein